MGIGRLGAVIALLALVAACGPPPKAVQPVPADGAMGQAARNLQAPPPDRARVIIVSGSTTRYTGSGGSYVAPHYMPGEILVNGTKIGTLNGLEAMVFDVAPGQYTFQWADYSKTGAVDLKSSIPLQRNLNGGGVLVLSTSWDSGLIVSQRHSLVPVRGPAGITNERADRPTQIVANYMIVRPQNCPPTICL
jgi:hypothetical protein